jgi:hypothetical protein
MRALAESIEIDLVCNRAASLAWGLAGQAEFEIFGLA